MQINSERFWSIADKITSTCTVCAFARGIVVGALLGLLALWLI